MLIEKDPKGESLLDVENGAILAVIVGGNSYEERMEDAHAMRVGIETTLRFAREGRNVGIVIDEYSESACVIVVDVDKLNSLHEELKQS